MTSSSNRTRPRRRLAGERHLTGERRRPRAAGSGPVVNQSSAPKAFTAQQTWTLAKPLPNAEAPPGKRAAAFAPHPGWVFAGLSLLLATAILVTSIVIWKAGDERRTQASREVAASSAARSIIEKLLGYDYRTFDRHTKDVSALLTWRFRNEFVQAATTLVKPLAVQNQAVVLAKVSKTSVMSTPGQADVRILVFVDQRTTSAKLERPQVDQNRVILTMSQVDGRWLVSKIEAF